MADRSSASTTELEVRDRAIVERVAAGLLPRRARDTFATAATTVGVEDEGRAVTIACQRSSLIDPTHMHHVNTQYAQG